MLTPVVCVLCGVWGAVPEISVRQVNRGDAFIVIASDGVFEFLTNQHTVDIIKEYEVRQGSLMLSQLAHTR